MVRLFVFLAAVQLVLWVLGLISCLSAARPRVMPRWLWVLVILLVPLLGPVAWFVFGRPLPPPSERGPVRRAPSRPSSPDDDPDFLRSIRIEQARRDRELLDRWERDLGDETPDDAPKQGEEDGPASRPPASGA